ncbi:cell division protein FtsX [Cobetia amphilecti]|uniref:permease-like cell division protein FtsX n=1 Tax=Cobetia TaxID=204286 RepID=UPI0005010E21|nr:MULTISPECIES: permease-like cell division protein FtsX [Cobetia]KGA01101.1 cell division protein FtsX [Cobetia amphilecti]MDH2297267.1 permease-like cell division protein FtsX [Cobetia sp. 29-18-1]
MSPPRSRNESPSSSRERGQPRAETRTRKSAAQAPGSPEAAERAARKGARSSRVSVESRYRSWLRHHAAMARDSARRLLVAPIASLLTMLAIAIALTLPAALWLALDSARLLDNELNDSAQLTLYLETSVDESQALTLSDSLRDAAGVGGVRLITAAEGMQEFAQALDLKRSLSLLDDNPLPASIVITPLDTTPESVRALATRLEGEPGVASARLDLAWLERLRQLGELGQKVTLGLALLFGLGVLLVVGNTIRLSVESRRQEIEVVTLIGATHAFVRRPFLYSGAWYGLGGGLLACGILALGGNWLAAPVTALVQSYGGNYVLPALGVAGGATLLFSSTILGWIGAWIAVGRHLASISPR